MPATYNVVPVVATGDWITAGWVNTYIGGNMAALWPGTAVGDMEYYLSATEKAKLAKPASRSILEMGNSGTPSWSTAVPGSFLSAYVDGGSVFLQWVTLPRYMTVLLNLDVPLVVGDDAFRFRVPAAINGWNIVTVAAWRQSGTGVPNIQIRNASTAVDILSTKLSIDSGETDSSTAAAPAVINTANDNVITSHQIAIDVDVAGTNTLRCGVEIGFLQP